MDYCETRVCEDCKIYQSSPGIVTECDFCRKYICEDCTKILKNTRSPFVSTCCKDCQPEVDKKQ